MRNRRSENNPLGFRTRIDLIEDLLKKGITTNKSGKSLKDCSLLEVGKVYYNKE